MQFIVERWWAMNNEFHQFCRQHSFSFIKYYPLLMSTISECERTVWKTLTSSLGCDWHCHSFHFAAGKRHPCRLMCIWTLLISSLLCTLGSCDMEIFSIVFYGLFFSFYIVFCFKMRKSSLFVCNDQSEKLSLS